MTRIRKRERVLAESAATTCLEIAREYARPGAWRDDEEDSVICVRAAVDGDARGVMMELIASVLAEYRRELDHGR